MKWEKKNGRHLFVVDVVNFQAGEAMRDTVTQHADIVTNIDASLYIYVCIYIYIYICE